MRGYPKADPRKISFAEDFVNVSDTGADLSYAMSRALGYAVLVGCSVLVATQLF